MLENKIQNNSANRTKTNALISVERDTTITVKICFSATGHYMPPMLVFPRKRMKSELIINASSGAWSVCSDSRWMIASYFCNSLGNSLLSAMHLKIIPFCYFWTLHSTKSIELIDEAKKWHNNTVLLISHYTSPSAT